MNRGPADGGSLAVRIVRRHDDGPDRWVVAALLALVSGTLALSALGPSSLWRDDAWVALVHRVSFTQALRMGVTAPGFTMAMRTWLWVVGFSELRAQIPAFLAFVATPPLLYLLALRMRLRWPAALLAATLLATSAPLLEVAGRVKVYSFDALAAVVVLWLGWDAAEEPAAPVRWVALAGGATLLTVMTSSSATAVAGAFLVALLAAWRAGVHRRGYVVGAVAGYGLFGLVWWRAVVARASTPSLKISFSGAMIPGKPGQARWAGIYARLADLVGHFTPLAPHHVPFFLVLLAVAVALGTARRPELTLLVVTPLAVAVVFALRRVAPLGGGSVITVNGSRIDVHLYPPLALLLAAGFESLLEVAGELRLAHRAAATVSSLALVAALIATASSPTYPLEDTKPLVADVEREATPADVVIVQTEARYQFALYTHWPRRIVFSRRFETGFTVATPQPNVVIMGSGPAEDGHSDSAVFGLVPSPPPPPAPTAPRVFLLTSTFYTSPKDVEDWLSAGGYVQTADRVLAGAALEVWSRTGG